MPLNGFFPSKRSPFITGPSQAIMEWRPGEATNGTILERYWPYQIGRFVTLHGIGRLFGIAGDLLPNNNSTTINIVGRGT